MSEGGIIRRETINPGAPNSTGPRDRPGRARLSEGVSEQLAFRVADELYALPLASVHEILKVGPVTEVPRAGRDVLGILSVRGRVTTVLDLRRRLRLAETPPTAAARLLLVEGQDEIVALLVDEVRSVFRLATEEIELAQQVGGDISDYVVGIGRPRVARGKTNKADDKREREREMLILLDPVALLRR